MLASGAAARREHLRASVAVIAIVVLAVVGVVQGKAAHDNGREVDREDRAVNAATEEVLALTSIDLTATQSDIDRILAGATDNFREQLASQAKAFRTSLAKSEVRSTGRVVSAGLTRIKGSKAVVLVATTGTVSNKGSSGPQPRNFRLRVSLAEVEGKWLVSGMEFV